MRRSKTSCLQSYDQRKVEHNHGSQPTLRNKSASRSEASKQPVHKKFESYTTFTTNKEHILNAIVHESYLRRAHPMKQGPNINKTIYCSFHKDYGHITEQCQKLKDEIECLIRMGHLKKYIRRISSEKGKKTQR